MPRELILQVRLKRLIPITIWGKFEELFGVTEELRESKESTKGKEELSNFYYKYLLSKTGYFAYKRLYSQFVNYTNKFLKGDNTLVAKLVSELKRSAYHYVSIMSKCQKPELEVAFNRFRQLEHDTAIPLVLHLYNRYERNKLSKSAFLDMLNIIESFILRRSILRRRTLRGYGEIFTKASNHAESQIILMKYFAEKDWPTDRQVRDAMKEYPLYDESKSQCKLILTEIERSYGHKEKVGLQELTIEHVMPQTLTENWRKMLGKDANKLHKKYFHTLGNLTLTGYNAEMSNRPYKEKRQFYLKSNLQLNSYFKDHQAWTAKEILERTDVLMDKFIKIWKKPSTIEPT